MLSSLGVAPSVVHVEATQYTYGNTREEEKLYCSLLNPVQMQANLQKLSKTSTNPSE